MRKKQRILSMFINEDKTLWNTNIEILKNECIFMKIMCINGKKPKTENIYNSI